MEMQESQEQKILQFIRDYSDRADRSPSFREIRDHLGVRSLSTVHYHVNKLIEQGVLANRDGHHGKRSLKVVPPDPEGAREIPLLGRIAAGLPIEAVEIPEKVTVPARFFDPENYVLQVEGDSMIEDGVLDGDLVVVRHARTAENREMVVALVDGEATLKRYVRTERGIELHPANPDYPVIHVTPDQEFEIRGKAIGVIREY
ncbi:MAG TPA: transcriptional repressor LexA [bacterium]|nr:transcriptional repressor LexA [bacterium]